MSDERIMTERYLIGKMHTLLEKWEEPYDEHDPKRLENKRIEDKLDIYREMLVDFYNRKLG